MTIKQLVILVQELIETVGQLTKRVHDLELDKFHSQSRRRIDLIRKDDKK